MTKTGGTLTELMVAVAILSIGVLGLFGAFRYIARSSLVSRAQSLATNLGQERIESLKNLNYYALQLTTATATDATVSPAITYDTSNYPPESISIGGINFTRYTYVSMAELTDGDISDVVFTYPDTGLKKIVVNIVWTEQGLRKKWMLSNLIENPNVNPLDATVTGTVSDAGGGTVASAIVVVEQNEDWGATTNASGVFTFQVYHGTYTLRVSSTGYSDSVSSSFIANRGGTTNVPLTLTAVATGYITGSLWYNSDIVVSQVVAATNTQVGDGSTRDVEYVELFNPTTSAINIGQTSDALKNTSMWYGSHIGGTYDYTYDWPAIWGDSFDMVNVTTYVAPGRYYLIANATSFVSCGQWVTADAYYDSAKTYPDVIKEDAAGSIYLYHWGSAVYSDIVGWGANGGGVTPPAYEATLGGGTYIPGESGHGLAEGNQLVRVSSPGISGAALPSYGRAYDSNNNNMDFLYESTFQFAPKNHAAGAFTVLTGKLPSSAYVSASDPNSGSTISFTSYITSAALNLPYTRFQLAAVSTGTWTVSAYYSGFSASLDTVTVNQNSFTRIPNSATVPAWIDTGLYHVQLNSSTVTGFVKGVVTNTANQPISGIVVQGAGSSKTTGTNGIYFMAVSTGTVTLVANPNNANPAYKQEIKSPTVVAGLVTTQDFTLELGGRLTGYVTTGTTPLAYQPVAAINGVGSQAGAGTTDATGVFTMRNISTGTYTVYPVLESGQDVSPNNVSVTLTSTGSVFVGTFTVSGAFGSISGTVSDASGLVTSGALILASTSAIASTPSAIVGSSAPALTPTYMASSKADGTYTLPVRGGSTYYLSVYVPVVSAAGSVSITTKTYSNIIVTPSAATTKNVTIP